MARVVIVPGNGGGDVYRANWYGWAHKTFKKNDKLSEVRLENMPDPVVARESVWIPYMEKELNCDESTIIIGHRSVLIVYSQRSRPIYCLFCSCIFLFLKLSFLGKSLFSIWQEKRLFLIECMLHRPKSMVAVMYTSFNSFLKQYNVLDGDVLSLTISFIILLSTVR